MTVFDRTEFAKRLKWLIYERGYNLYTFAEECQLSQPTVCNYLGARRIPELQCAINMAEALNVSLDYLIKGKEIQKNEIPQYLLCETSRRSHR